MRHVVRCPLCLVLFDLFEAAWCDHSALEPSKLCPACRRCLCEHPEYSQPELWKEAPLAFRRNGFRRLFVRYL